MKIAIVMTAYQRTTILEEVLESWSRVEGIEDVKMQVFIDRPSGVPADAADRGQNLIRNIVWEKSPGAVPSLMGEPLGNARNTYRAIAEAFTLDGADFVIVAEDDILVGTDILRYFQWAAQVKPSGDEILAVLAHSQNGTMKDCGRVGDLTDITQTFSPLVWGTWRERWERIISPTWDFDYSTGDGDQKGWDWNLTRTAKALGMVFLHPGISRSQHIGAEGLHCTPELQEQIFLKGWTPDIDPDRSVWPNRTAAFGPRDELAKLIFTIDNSGAANPVAEWEWAMADTDYAYDIADGLIAAGYTKEKQS